MIKNSIVPPSPHNSSYSYCCPTVCLLIPCPPVHMVVVVEREHYPEETGGPRKELCRCNLIRIPITKWQRVLLLCGCCGSWSAWSEFPISKLRGHTKSGWFIRSFLLCSFSSACLKEIRKEPYTGRLSSCSGHKVPWRTLLATHTDIKIRSTASLLTSFRYFPSHPSSVVLMIMASRVSEEETGPSNDSL